jgi:hypothetical protein
MTKTDIAGSVARRFLAARTSYPPPRNVVGAMDPLLRLIIKRALSEKSFQGLIDSWVDDKWEEEQLEHEGEDYEDFVRKFQILDNEQKIEETFQKAYVALYRRLRGGSVGDALDGLDYDVIKMPRRNVPVLVIKLIAEALAQRDAAEAKALQEMAKAKGWG